MPFRVRRIVENLEVGKQLGGRRLPDEVLPDRRGLWAHALAPRHGVRLRASDDRAAPARLPAGLGHVCSLPPSLARTLARFSSL